MKYNFKLWIEDNNGNQLIGEGMELLLKLIHETGSINKAASKLNMSYRTAWAKVKKAEERLGIDLVKKRVGGKDGGGSTLTPDGMRLLDSFSELHLESKQELEKLYKKHFSFFIN